jgi:pimeloyl-ACP methyl ester carboxylesterase
MKHPPIIMLSGMGADARVFKKQVQQVPRFTVPEWIEPLPGEPLAQYAERFAAAVDPGEPCLIGGASFGGFVALEMVRHLDARGCVLVGSVRSPDELPGNLKALRRVAGASKALPFGLLAMGSKVALSSCGTNSETHWADLLRQISDSDAAFLRWACGAVLEWRDAPDIGNTPIHQIHGGKDFVLPARNTRPDVVIADAGHALSMSHPDEVTDFIRQRVQNNP